MTSCLRVIMVRQGDAKKCVYMGLLRPGRVTLSCSPVCAVAGVRPVCIKWERSRVRRCECPSTASSTTFTTQASAGRTTRGTSALQRRVVPATARRYIASPCFSRAPSTVSTELSSSAALPKVIGPRNSLVLGLREHKYV